MLSVWFSHWSHVLTFYGLPDYIIESIVLTMMVFMGAISLADCDCVTLVGWFIIRVGTLSVIL